MNGLGLIKHFRFKCCLPVLDLASRRYINGNNTAAAGQGITGGGTQFGEIVLE